MWTQKHNKVSIRCSLQPRRNTICNCPLLLAVFAEIQLQEETLLAAQRADLELHYHDEIQNVENQLRVASQDKLQAELVSYWLLYCLSCAQTHKLALLRCENTCH